jgi:hypothetical protein
MSPQIILVTGAGWRRRLDGALGHRHPAGTRPSRTRHGPQAGRQGRHAA